MGSTIEMLAKQQEVKALYMSGKRTTKEISGIAGVSEQAINGWVKKFKWKEARDFRIKRDMLIDQLEYLDTDYLLKGFADFMTSKQPFFRVQWGLFINEYKEYLKGNSQY